MRRRGGGVHRLRGRVLTDASGAVESLVLVVNDETERFSGRGAV